VIGGGSVKIWGYEDRTYGVRFGGALYETVG
jgi:hypothetical protein